MKTIYLGLLISLLTATINAQNSLNFDGTDDKVDCGNNSSVQITGTTITIEAWIYPTGWKTNVWEGNIINKENNNPDYGYMLRCGDGGKLNFNLGNNAWNELTTSSGTLTLNTWQHVAGSYDGNMMRLYVNGVAVDSISTSISISSTLQNLTIGNWSSSFDRAFIGSIDEVRVWSSVRSKAEINNTMNTEFCVIPANLVAYYKLNEGVASGNNSGVTTAVDFSGNNNNGTLSSFALTGSTSNWVNGVVATMVISQGTDTRTECNPYTWIDGNVYTTSNNTAAFNIVGGAANGCDSLVTLDLTIITVDTGTTTSGITISCNATGATYQWLDCDNAMGILSGETNQSFSAASNGNYAVEVTENGCVDTSACVAVTVIGVIENSLEEQFVVYPNPTQGNIAIEFDNVQEYLIVSLLTVTGQLLETKTYTNSSKIELEIKDTAGIYFIDISDNNDARSIIRIVKE